jgi:CheY-like chemotaxis protein
MVTEHPYSILITDDDRGSREALREIFEPQGFRTLMAESGEEAIDIVRDEVVHVALMDVHLPRLTGLETMEILRQFKQLLPVILISAEYDDQLLRRALSAHAYSVLAKPLSKNLVIYVVTRALEKFYCDPA